MKNNISIACFNHYLNNAKFERLSDISFAYRYEDKSIVLAFYQDEIGKNILDEYAMNINGVWFTLVATDEQLKAMWNKLNSTSLAFDDVETESDIVAGDWENLNGQWLWNPQI